MLLMLAFLTVPAQEAFSFPWDTENTVANALLLPDGQNVVCEQVVVDKIVARQEPAYFVVRDIFNSRKKIVILCRPPFETRTGQTLDITGTAATLSNGEKCIINPAIYGYFDRNSKMILWSPAAGYASRQILPIPTSAVLPCDPAYSSSGLLAQVTSNRPAVSMYSSVESLVSAAPSVLSPVELACKPVKATGEGFIIVGDDRSSSTIKVFTNSKVASTDRIVRLSGTVHTDGGSLVIYADAGPEPYFDPQGYRGYVSAAGIGTTAYAATLDDGPDSAPSGTSGIMSAGTSGALDGSWVYLTGQVVTSKVPYWSQSAGPTGDWIDVVYIQGIDGTPGIRVFPTAGFPDTPGSVLDVMGKLSTTDGERSLGYNGYIEYKTHPNTGMTPPPLGISNSNLGGSSLGNNPGITDATGLYNIGSLVRVWGRVVEIGSYNLDLHYAKISDGSNTSFGGVGLPDIKGVALFTNDLFSLYQYYNGYVSVVGPSSVWLPDISGTGASYRAIWLSDVGSSIKAYDSQSGGTSPTTDDGVISGTVYIYDGTPDSTVNVKVYCSDWQSIDVPIALDRYTGCGSGTYTFTNVPEYYGTLKYIVSAECDGFKSRTCADVTPGTVASPQIADFYLVPLRKITVSADKYSIDICQSTRTATVTATVVGPDNRPLPDVNVRFWADNGSFDGGASYTISGHTYYYVSDATDAQGKATATLVAGLDDAGEKAYIWATDDDHTPWPNDGLFEAPQDPCKYDWEPLPSSDTNPGYISFSSYPLNVTLSLTKNKMAMCSDTVTATAFVTGCNNEAVPDGTDVKFKLVSGYDVAEYAGGGTECVIKTAGGEAQVPIHGKTAAIKDDTEVGVSASVSLHNASSSSNQTITVIPYIPHVEITATPDVVTTAPTDITITVKATDRRNDPPTPMDVSIVLKTNMGAFTYPASGKQVSLTTDANGQATATLRLGIATSALLTATFNDNCHGTRTITKWIKHYAPSFADVGVNYSSPLVADLIPGGGMEVAVIGKGEGDGFIHVWNSDGSPAWISTNHIDTGGNNTLSAANIDGDSSGTLEITAPCSIDFGYPDKGRLYAYGYNGTFKLLAGWPTSTYYQYERVAAALGDANLDGTTKVVAGDLSCVVTSWNSIGQQLWKQVTKDLGVSIDNSSVALGQINTTTIPNRPPEAVVGAVTDPGLWGFEGNEWHDYFNDIPPYHYTSRWAKPAGLGIINMQSSPAIGLIDDDSGTEINDIAVGSNDGKLWVWLSSDSAWHTYSVNSQIWSSPVIVEINGQRSIIFGSDNGRVYRVYWNEATGTLEDVPGWSGGILLAEGYDVKASPVVGDVMNTSLPGSPDPQIVVANTDGNVYALWKDGINNPNGPVARIWACSYSDNEKIYSTPTICSLDGSNLNMIVASTNNVYKLQLYQTTSFEAGAPCWPWPTFHYNAARTGCSTSPSTTMISASIIGRVKTSAEVGIPGAVVQVQYKNGANWIDDTSVNGRTGVINGVPITRGPVTTVGNGTNNDEINEGGFVISQLQPNRPYRLKVTYSGVTREFNVNNQAPLSAQMYPQDVTW